MNICFVSYRFPGKHNSTDFIFVKKLVDAIATMGHHCYVLTPFNVLYYRSFSKNKEEYLQGKGKVTVYRPTYLSFSKLHFGDFYVSDWTYKRALKRAFRMMNIIPDILYGHFWNSAYSAFQIANQFNIPLFVATGESEIGRMFTIPKDIDSFREYVRGVICVSSKNKNESISLRLTTEDKCIVLPNAVDSLLFHKYDQRECRSKLGFPQDAFIVAFVGWFNERKGAIRVAKAINRIQGVNSIFIGSGEQEPYCEGILYKGASKHQEIPEYLGSADCFVLPTLHEGCCNAVIEALACGLPVISSNLPFNWDVLDATNSILIDPNSIEEIENAIRTLKDSPFLLSKLKKGALESSKDLSITRRAESIMSFITSKT